MLTGFLPGPERFFPRVYTLFQEDTARTAIRFRRFDNTYADFQPSTGNLREGSKDNDRQPLSNLLMLGGRHLLVSEPASVGDWQLVSRLALAVSTLCQGWRQGLAIISNYGFLVNIGTVVDG
jgi:hypothetical protein